MEYPWDSEDAVSQCLRCDNFNFSDRDGTGPLTCRVFPHGIPSVMMINKERCDYQKALKEDDSPA